MSFPRDAYPYTNFHELNLGYFIVHFREIFSQWADLYDQMLDWKDATTDELAAWKTGVEADLDQREAALRAELETWKAQTGQDIAGWEDATLAALTAWQTATQAVFEAIRVEAAGSASAAAASAGDAATAKTAAETAQAAAEAAAASVQASAAQIATNTGDIADLKTQLKFDESNIKNQLSQLYGKNLFNPLWLQTEHLINTETETYGKSSDFATDIGTIPFIIPQNETAITLSLEAYVDVVSGDSGSGVVIKVFRFDGTTLAQQLAIPNNTADWTNFSITIGPAVGVNGIQFYTSSNANNITHIRKVQLEKGTAQTTYENPLTGYDKKSENNLNNHISEYNIFSDKTSGDIKEINGEINGGNIGFEYGNITYSADGFTYMSTHVTIRTPESLVFELDIGDTLYLSDYSNLKFYVGWIMTHETEVQYGYNSTWIENGKYKAIRKGNYKIVLRHKDNSIFNDLSDSSYFIVEKKNSYKGKIESEQTKNIIQSSNIKDIAHRGMRTIAPENTAPAFIYAKEAGFKYVETDIWPTSDGHYVMIHDATINRTSNGTGTVYAMTLAELKALDFGSWFSVNFTGEKILTFEEFMTLCRKLGLHPYIELKHDSTFTAWSAAQITDLVNIVKDYGMLDKVTWIDFGNENLSLVLQNYDTANIGILVTDVTDNNVTSLLTLMQTAKKQIFFDASYPQLTSTGIGKAKTNNAPLEVYSADSQILNADPYISGFTTDGVFASVILYENGVS